MSSSPSLEGVDRVIHETERVKVGAWRCPLSDPRFRDSGPIEHFIFFFPRGRLWIRHEGERAFPVDSNVVTIYNRGQRYTREPIGPEGDAGDWYAVDPGTLREAVHQHDPSVDERPQRPFPFSYGPSDASLYMAQREVFSRLVRGDELDDLELEERVFALLERVLALAYQAWQPRWSRQPGTPSRPELEAAHRAQALLDSRYRDPISLAAIAAEVGVSRFRLCRIFKAATGMTLQAYRDQLRLRTALEELSSPDGDLTQLALDLGYSSHSHFTANFRRVFGLPPGRVRRQIAPGQARLRASLFR